VNHPERFSRVGVVKTIALIFGSFLGAALSAQPSATVRVGVLEDNFPYSYVGADGRVTGFATELVQEIEAVMGMRFERVRGTTPEISRAFAEGRIDFIQSFAYLPEREADVEFTVPYLIMAGTIFVREDLPGIKSLDDLRGHRVLVHRDSLGDRLLRRAGLGDVIVYVDTVEEALVKVDRGEGDATLASRLTGLSLAHHLNLSHLKAVPGNVEGYDVRYCIAVRKGESRLLAQLNEGLAVLVRTGRFDEVYQKWFSHVEPKGYSVEQVLLAVAGGLLLALLVALWAVWRQRRLHRQIARQSADLQIGAERYRGLFEGTPDGLLVLDHTGNADKPIVLQTNPAARRMLQTGSGPEPGVRLDHVLAGDPVLATRLITAARENRVAEFEHEMTEPAVWWRVSLSPLGGRLLVSLRDITEQTQARLRLQRQDEHMRQTQKIEALGTLAGGIAHDFNNLLTSIIGNTQLTLMNLEPGHPEAESLEQVLKASRRAQQLVKQILSFSRRSDVSRQPLRLAPLVDEVIGFLGAVTRGTVEFAHQPESTGALIPADAAQVHQVLMNIGNNAVQAMRGTPGHLSFVEEVVSLDAKTPLQTDLKPGRYLRLTVTDTGPGMSPEVLNRLFEPFFTTKPMGEGTGLGLSVVHGIMLQHDGAVSVTSALGKGTRFMLYFPLAENPAPAPVEVGSNAVRPGNGESVLFLDDDPSIVDTVRKILQRLGYKVEAHLRADDALAVYSANPDRFSLVISDLTMPGLNGLQFAGRVRALRPELPIVLVSGYWTEGDLGEARRMGLRATLHKPLTYEILGRVVADHLLRD